MPIFGHKCQCWAKFDTHLPEITPRQLVCTVFWLGIGLNGPNCLYLAKNVSFGPNLAVFCPKIRFLPYEGKLKFDQCFNVHLKASFMLLDIENINFASSQFDLDIIFLSGKLQTTS